MGRTFLACAVLGMMLSARADSVGWMGSFLEKPDEATFRKIERQVETEGAALEGGQGEGLALALFLGRVSKWNGWPIQGTGSVGKVAARIASDGRKIDAYLADEQLLNPGKISLRWAEYFASGDTTYLDKIVAFAGRAFPQDDPGLAKVISVTNASFKVNGGRFPAVTDYLKRCREDPEMRDRREFFDECLASGPMTRIVSRVVAPEGDAKSFAARPKTFYSVGNRYCRIEEEPDLTLNLHGLGVMNGRDGWMINLRAGAGAHITDPGPTYSNSAPLVPPEKGKRPRVSGFQMGSEREFMRERGIKPKAADFLERKAQVYEIEIEGLVLKLFVDPDSGRPLGVEVSEGGKLLSRLAYDEYQTGLPFDRALFLPPPGVRLTEPAAK